MKTLILLLVLVGVSSCAVKRTKDSDKSMRVMLDPKSLDQNESMSVKAALFDSGKFYIVDRSQAYNAVIQEQDRQHSDDNRFENSQKYAQWGKMYGAGSVIVASSKCGGLESNKNLLYLAGHLATLGMFDKTLCTQNLELVDTATGEILVSVKNETGKKYNESQDWSDIVDKLVDAYPKYFESVKKHERLLQYEEQSRMEAEQRILGNSN